MSRPADDKTTNPDSWGSFEPYAQLLRSLLPRAQAISLFNARGELRWSSESGGGSHLQGVVSGTLAAARSAPESAGALHMLPGNVPLYVCWLRDESQHMLAVVAVLCRPEGPRDGEPRSFSLAHALLKPALECLRRELLARVSIGRLKRTVDALEKVRRGGAYDRQDALTGLYTRPAFEQRVRAVVASTESSAAWSTLYINVDQLHIVNDNLGMHVGDSVLGQLGELLRNRLPPGAFAARISGDRFAVLVPAHLDDAERFGESLREGAEQLGTVHGSSRLRVSISVGIAALDTSAGELMHSLAAAETACKAAKDRGRNRVEVYRANDVSLVRRFADINIVGRLHDAINTGRLRLDAQLILPFGHEGHLKPHYELLVRMLDEDGAEAGPESFLSAANRYQLMPSIDRWVIESAVEQLKAHAPMLSGAPLSFAINFSGQSLNDEAFSDFLTGQIESSGLSPALFCFELTENATIASVARAVELMRRLRALGCGIALDDFGTGLSSLSALRQLPVTMLKIDGSFVRDVIRDPRAESMVRAIAQLARTMALTTVAEYVETEEIRLRIATLGVDYGQGFAIARPLPLEELLAGMMRDRAGAAPRSAASGASCV